jgi:hypothetical protein
VYNGLPTYHLEVNHLNPVTTCHCQHNLNKQILKVTYKNVVQSAGNDVGVCISVRFGFRGHLCRR